MLPYTHCRRSEAYEIHFSECSGTCSSSSPQNQKENQISDQTVVLGVLFVIPAFCGFVSVVYWFSFVLRLRERGLTEYSSSMQKGIWTEFAERCVTQLLQQWSQCKKCCRLAFASGVCQAVTVQLFNGFMQSDVPQAGAIEYGKEQPGQYIFFKTTKCQCWKTGIRSERWVLSHVSTLKLKIHFRCQIATATASEWVCITRFFLSRRILPQWLNNVSGIWRVGGKKMQGMRRLSPRLKLRSVDFCCSFLDGSEVFCLYFGCFATNVVFVGTLVTTASVSESSDNTVPFVCGVLKCCLGSKHLAGLLLVMAAGFGQARGYGGYGLSEETETIQSEAFHLVNQMGSDLTDNILFKLLQVSSEKLFPPFFLKKWFEVALNPLDLLWLRTVASVPLGESVRCRADTGDVGGHGTTWEFDGLSIKRWNDETAQSKPRAVRCETMWNNVRHWLNRFWRLVTLLAAIQPWRPRCTFVRSNAIKKVVKSELCYFLNFSLFSSWSQHISTLLESLVRAKCFGLAWCSRWKPVKTSATALTVFGASHDPDWKYGNRRVIV